MTVNDSDSLFNYESLGDGYYVCVSKEHRFGTDAFLLADFAAPHRKDKVCDLCSGSGIVALVMAKRFSPQRLYAVELQDKAYEQLVLSAEKSCCDTLLPVHSDLKLWRSDVMLDLITCNPPYKSDNTGLKNNSEEVTIARHETQCTIYDVCACAKRSLRFGGRLCVCQRPERLPDVICAMRECGIEPKRLRTVHKDSRSEPWLILVEGRQGGSRYLKIERPLYIKSEDGSDYSQEMKIIYGIGD